MQWRAPRRQSPLVHLSVRRTRTLTRSDEDWHGSRVSLDVEPTKDGTHMRFAHFAWPDANDHYRTSSSCRAMYLRVVKRHLETGEQVPSPVRLDV